MSRFEEVQSRVEEVLLSDKNFKNAIEVFGKRFDIEFENRVKCFQSFIRQSSISINLDNLGEEGGGNGITLEPEGGKEGLHERKVAGMAKFEDEGMPGGI